RGLLPALVLLLIVALLIARSRWPGRRHRHMGSAGEPPAAAMAESARVALPRHDWERAQSLLGRLLERDPRDPTLIAASALALHRAAWLQDPGQRHSPCRTSLDRIAAEQRALALIDSAAGCAEGFEHWARSRERMAQAYQNLGLFTDALEVYR